MLAFIKSVIRWFVSFWVALALLGLSLVLLILALALVAQPSKVHVPQGAVLEFNLGVGLQDRPQDEHFSDALADALQGGESPQVTLYAATQALEAAARDERIAGLVLTGYLSGGDYGSSFAALAELRRAILRFRETGKPVLAYLDGDNAAEIYLKSVAGEVSMHPFGTLDFKGLALQRTYWGETFEKYGVGVQVTRLGRYKSYADGWVRREMAPEDREQNLALIEDLWSELRDGVAQARKLEISAVDTIAHEAAVLGADQAKELGLVDTVRYDDEMREALIAIAGSDGAGDYQRVLLEDYVRTQSHNAPAFHLQPKPEIAVVYAEGVIIDGTGDAGEVGSSDYVQVLRDLAADENVRAVVLRVNSPGGSASASERILREAYILRDTKPLIVSMGGVAASGGYWISTAADRIYVEPSTITGSIGVIGLYFNFGQLGERFGVHWDGVQTAPHADLWSITRPKSEWEMNRLQSLVDTTYVAFLARVAENRGMTPDEVHALAQGRVWSGRDAIGNRLADVEGGLEDAIREAAVRAQIEDQAYQVGHYPRQRTLAETLRDRLHAATAPSVETNTPWQSLVDKAQAELRSLRHLRDERGVYALAPWPLRVE